MKTEDRFSDRVDNYIKYRPHYPAAVYDYLVEQNIVTNNSLIADVGCGTGISSQLFLEHGNKVFGIEPNAKMLEAAVGYLSMFPSFVPIMAGAEATTLPVESIDLVICAQAFHWFNIPASRKEFKRILKPGGHVALMWNDRHTDTTDFLKVYEDFLQMFGTDYKTVNHKNVQNKQVFEDFFGGDYKEKTIYNYQDLDFEGLKGRVLSSSYMPNEQHSDFNHMNYCLRKIFQRYQYNGTVKLEYDTKLYYGKIV